MTRVYLKLAFSGLRRRRLQAALTVVVVAAATATIALAQGVGRVADRPWERTFEATNAAHVTAFAIPPGKGLDRLAELPGVAATTGVVPQVFSAFRHEGGRYGIRLAGASATPPQVSRPLVVD